MISSLYFCPVSRSCSLLNISKKGTAFAIWSFKLYLNSIFFYLLFMNANRVVLEI
jgi:hypothetical protein